jgi:flagellar motor switch protein FliN/FliY
MSDEVLSPEEIEALVSQGGAANGEAKPDAADAAAGDEQQAVAEDSPPEITVASDSDRIVRPMEFSQVGVSAGAAARGGMDLIMDVNLQVTVELGRTLLKVRDVLALGPGAVVELDKHAGEPVDVVVNNKTVARGEVVVIDENFGVRLTEIIDKEQRDARAKAA